MIIVNSFEICPLIVLLLSQYEIKALSIFLTGAQILPKLMPHLGCTVKPVHF